MNSFMKSKKEAENARKCDVISSPIITKKVEEESKTSPSFTFKDFQKSINEKKERPKVPTSSFPDELPKEAKLPLPLTMNPNNGVDVESKTIEAVNEELANEELEEEIEKEKIKEKEKIYEDETEDEEDDEKYKVVKFALIPFIFTEKYEQVNGFIKNYNISCYSFLNIINNGIISENEFKLIENQIKERLIKLLNVRDEDIRIKLNKNDDSQFEYECCVKIYEDEFNVLIGNEDRYILFREINLEYQETYEKKYKDDEEFDHLTDYLEIYFKKIYSFCPNGVDNIYEVINEAFTCENVNPFTYTQNTIPFKEIRTKTKDDIITRIMKMGFIFSRYVKEIKKNKD